MRQGNGWRRRRADLKEQVVQELREATSSPANAAGRRAASGNKADSYDTPSPSYFLLGFTPSHRLRWIQCSNDEATNNSAAASTRHTVVRAASFHCCIDETHRCAEAVCHRGSGGAWPRPPAFGGGTAASYGVCRRRYLLQIVVSLVSLV